MAAGAVSMEVRWWLISLKKAASGNWHRGGALIHSGR